MRNLILIAMVTLTATAFAEDNSSKFEAYQQRLAARRATALNLRRALNAAKGPHLYYMTQNVPKRRFIAIEEGLIRQPPIPMRDFYVAPYPTYWGVVQGTGTYSLSTYDSLAGH